MENVKKYGLLKVVKKIILNILLIFMEKIIYGKQI